jgi:hypothetical protein
MTSGQLIDADALRTNGGMVHIRSACPTDFDALVSLNAAAAPRLDVTVRQLPATAAQRLAARSAQS